MCDERLQVWERNKQCRRQGIGRRVYDDERAGRQVGGGSESGGRAATSGGAFYLRRQALYEVVALTT